MLELKQLLVFAGLGYKDILLFDIYVGRKNVLR